MRFNLSTMSDIVCDDSGEVPVTRYTGSVAVPAAKEYGLGLEIAEYCISDNLDMNFAETDALVRQKIAGFDDLIFHAPYNELYPSAIDPKAVELARLRYDQAYAIAESYGAKKIVIHSGFVPMIYYPGYFAVRSIEFWKDFLDSHPGDMVLCLENVMETEPDTLLEIVEKVGSPRFRLTYDVGHAFVTTHPSNNLNPKLDICEWLERCAPLISHFHIHNNLGRFDTHDPLNDGAIDMESFLSRAVELCPDATFTVECMESGDCARWLSEKGFLEA